MLDFARADSRVTLLGVHGWGGTAAEFAPLAAELPAGVRLVAADFPGTGSSTPVDDEMYTMELFVSVLHDLVEQMRLAPVVLVGHSLGGKIAAVFAARFPEAVSALVLIAPYGLSKQERAGERLAASWSWLARVGARLNNRAAIRWGLRHRVYHDPARIPEAVAEHVIASQLAPAGRRAIAAVAHAMIGVDPIDELLPGLEAPALIVWGSEDRVVPSRAAARYAALMPGARLRLIDRCGHVPMAERPLETARLIAGFLEDNGLLAE